MSRRILHTEIGILAPAARAWEILVDTESWPSWNPFIVSVEGKLAPGASLVVRLEPPGKSAMTFRPQIVKWEPGREFRWLGRLGVQGLFDGEHGFRIVPESEGRCRLEQFETFTGLLVAPIMWLSEEATSAGFVAMNRAFKSRVERIALPGA